MPRGARTVIVGGGLAGLSCARELGRDFILLEAEDRLGGLVRTDQVEGFSFDWTGHWLHARDADEPLASGAPRSCSGSWLGPPWED